MKLAQILEARYTSREPQYRCKNCRAAFTKREMIPGRGGKPPANVKHCPRCGASHIIKTITYTSPMTGHSTTIPSELKEAKYFDQPNQTKREADLLIKLHQTGDQFEGWWIEYNPTFIVFNAPVSAVESDVPDKMWVSREDLDPRSWKKVVRVARFIEQQNPKYHFISGRVVEAKYFGEPNYSERDADLLINWHEAGDQFEGWGVAYYPTHIVFMEPSEFESEGPDKRWVSREDLDPRMWKKVVRVARFIEKQNPEFVGEAQYTGGKYADWVRDRTPLNIHDTNELKLDTPQEFEKAKAQLITMLGKPKIFSCEVTNKPGCHYRWKIPTRFTFADYIHLYVAWAGNEEKMTAEHGYYAELIITPDRDIR